MSASFKVISPARYHSSRLPGKPLVDLDGIPMVVRTYRQCLDCLPADQIVVATDHELIANTCFNYHVPVVMTSSNCLTGTDRVAESMQYFDCDFFINVQGDEPLFNPHDLDLLIKSAISNPSTIYNGYCSIDSTTSFHSVTTPKVVFDVKGRLLYMSRAPIPGNKDSSFKFAFRQVCAYSFPRTALLRFTSSPKTPLEETEDIEILRFLELGLPVQMLKMSNRSIPVDVPEDITKLLSVLNSK